jgi:hypothetical protein
VRGVPKPRCSRRRGRRAILSRRCITATAACRRRRMRPVVAALLHLCALRRPCQTVRCWRGPLGWASHAARTDVEASGYCKRAISSAAKLTTHTSTFRTLPSWAMAASVPLSGFGLATQTATMASASCGAQSAGLKYRQCSESQPRA